MWVQLGWVFTVFAASAYEILYVTLIPCIFFSYFIAEHPA